MRGEDPRSNEEYIKNKASKFMDKKGGSGAREKYAEKSMKKIQERSRPTRSKLIMKR